MGIEERIENLEILNEKLKHRVDDLENKQTEHYATPKELAEIMQCSVNHIYVKIRSGEVFATDKLGPPRIPMSQFNENNPKEKLIKKKRGKNKTKKETKEQSLKDSIFQ